MIHTFFELLRTRTFYAQVKSSWMSLFDVKTSQQYASGTAIALCEGHIVGIGDADNLPKFHEGKPVQVQNAFSHPRLILSELRLAEATMRYFLRQLTSHGFLRRPIVLVHLCESYDGGVAPVELHLLGECWMHAGAKEVYISMEQRTYAVSELRSFQQFFQQYSCDAFSAFPVKTETRSWWRPR